MININTLPQLIGGETKDIEEANHLRIRICENINESLKQRRDPTYIRAVDALRDPPSFCDSSMTRDFKTVEYVEAYYTIDACERYTEKLRKAKNSEDIFQLRNNIPETERTPL